jgi:hypothetical protein
VDGSKHLETWFVDCKHYKRGVPPTALVGLLAWFAKCPTGPSTAITLPLGRSAASAPARHHPVPGIRDLRAAARSGLSGSSAVGSSWCPSCRRRAPAPGDLGAPVLSVMPLGQRLGAEARDDHAGLRGVLAEVSEMRTRAAPEVVDEARPGGWIGLDVTEPRVALRPPLRPHGAMTRLVTSLPSSFGSGTRQLADHRDLPQPLHRRGARRRSRHQARPGSA